MAKDATKIFGGPAKSIEVSTTSGFSSPFVLGYASPDVQIKWEPKAVDTLQAQKFQPKGVGSISVKLQQTDSATLAQLKLMRTAEYYIRVTDYKSNVIPTKVPMLFSYTWDAPYNENDVHTLTVTAQIATEEPDDFVTLLT